MRKSILFILLLSIFSTVFSYNVNMIIEHYSVDQGLPNNNVNCSLKDKDGFIWFGTWYGLCRFDGVKFKTYDRLEFDESAIPPRKIQRIVEDKNGFIWIKTIDRKLYVFNKEKEIFYAVFDDMKNYSENIQVIKLQSTLDGDILLLTKDKNLLLAQTDEEGTISLKLLFDSKDEIDIQNYRLKHNVLCETEDYISWVGQDYKILSFKKNETLSAHSPDFILSKMNAASLSDFTAVYEHNTRIWVGDKYGIFYSIDTQTGSVDKYVLSELKGKIVYLMVSPTGYVYLSLEGQGIFEYDLSERKIKKINLNINPDQVSYAYMDNYDKMWFHENEKALVYYDPVSKDSKRFPFALTDKTGLLHIEDVGESGLFFLSPTGEAWLFNRETSQMVEINQIKKIASDQSDQRFFHLFQDHEGGVWLSSTTQGVYRMNFPKKQFRLFTLPELPNSYPKDEPGVRALFQSASGDIWVGTRWKTLYQYDKDGKLKQIFSDEKYKLGTIYHILEDRDGNLWFATKGNGLILATPDENETCGYRFKHFRSDSFVKNSLSGNDVYYTYQDSKGRIWAGLLDGGLNLLCEENGEIVFKNKNNGFVNYPSHGLYMEVRNIVEDGNGKILVGTMDGLMSFDSNFTSVEDIEFEIYHRKNSSNFMDTDVNTLYKDSDSQIWISMFGGGLSRLTGYNKETHHPDFKVYGLIDGLNSDVIISMVEDHDERLWFATESGLSYYDLADGRIRNFDKYDGFPSVALEDNAALRTQDGELWLGCKQGILMFSPDKLESHCVNYKTYIVGCKISNKDIRSYTDEPIIDSSISYADEIILKHKQSMFTIEFAALNFNNQNRISYRYILEGYEKEWHYNGKNRIASYTNVPPGKYTFKVQTLDEANPDLDSSHSILITILPPWWASGWAYFAYSVMVVLLLILAIRLTMFMIKVKNDIYIEQRLSELKIKFFTNISHELRTPLTLIIGPIQELKEKENLTTKGRQYVDLMERNVTQMLQLVNQILDFRKIQNGKMRLHVSYVNLSEIVRSFEKEFKLLADENGINFSFKLPKDDIKIWADKDKLPIVLRNLLSNAFKFTKSGENVVIVVEADNEKRTCAVKVEDNGVGIPQNKLTEIFERFSQAGNASNSYYKGTGIGLALSKEIVNMHHGRIFASSVENQGATFTVELKMDKEHFDASEVDFYLGENVDDSLQAETKNDEVLVEIEATDEDEQNTDDSLPTLLVVEDNKDLCNMLKLQLEERFNIFTAGDGVEGLKKVHLYHPDIIVTDQMMPNMDGLHMLKNIRNDFQVSHIPVIILTAKGNDESKTKAISMGANAYINKPFSKDYLVARIDQLLNERKLFQERMHKFTDNPVNEDHYEQYLVTKDVQFIDKIHELIEVNLENSDFNIDTIATTMGLSRSAFFKKLKGLTGLAPVDLIKEIRLNKSIELIKNTDMTITEIAFAVGFKDSGYFSKCFRKKYNQSPKEYIGEWKKADNKDYK